jgi:RNA polymerase sigma-70 factor (ECF subfamily)
MRSERVEHTLQPTALVNEVYLKLVKTPVASEIPRTEFLAIASHAMRQVLVDHARGRHALKRGGGWDRISINTNLGGADDSSDVDLIALDEALRKLASQDERTGRVVELRYFGGLTIAQTAETLGVSHGTVESDWAFGRAWLKQRLEGGGT